MGTMEEVTTSRKIVFKNNFTESPLCVKLCAAGHMQRNIPPEFQVNWTPGHLFQGFIGAQNLFRTSPPAPPHLWKLLPWSMFSLIHSFIRSINIFCLLCRSYRRDQPFDFGNNPEQIKLGLLNKV